MKLKDIPVETRFEYQGRVFVKTGPITATAEDGSQRLIPRYADLRPIDPLPIETDGRARRQLDETKVLNAFDAFYRTCLRTADDSSRPELELARQRFLAELK
ncbi:hypothetical protein [Accumulibacter sp.]|uniref:hypothetical protein n=1 Tax=Accumulibacter sp. TaxID=2053492 RepID=UPI0025CC2F59|nr:hypothetical protein [Accumulibacter sp.]MCM8594811.1 hypothetical protein [Accumulibacter sp.]MCM8625084.1 hypothetical protein [Accumulibacter sp.]MDS4048956.1 hypothetical protein [Accumulibacter sp.]